MPLSFFVSDSRGHPRQPFSGTGYEIDLTVFYFGISGTGYVSRFGDRIRNRLSAYLQIISLRGTASLLDNPSVVDPADGGQLWHALILISYFAFRAFRGQDTK